MLVSVYLKVMVDFLHMSASVSDCPYHYLHCKDKEGQCPQLIIFFELLSSQYTEFYYRDQTSLKDMVNFQRCFA